MVTPTSGSKPPKVKITPALVRDLDALLIDSKTKMGIRLAASVFCEDGYSFVPTLRPKTAEDFSCSGSPAGTRFGYSCLHESPPRFFRLATRVQGSVESS